MAEHGDAKLAGHQRHRRPRSPRVFSSRPTVVATTAGLRHWLKVAQWRSLHRNGDLLGYNWRVERVVLAVAEHQLQRVLAGWQVNTRLSLPGAEVKMCFVLGDWLVCVDRFVDVDQQMMMTAVCGGAARLSNAHVAQTKPAPKRNFYSRAIRRPNNVEKGVGGRSRSLRVRGDRQPGQQGDGGYAPQPSGSRPRCRPSLLPESLNAHVTALTYSTPYGNFCYKSKNRGTGCAGGQSRDRGPDISGGGSAAFGAGELDRLRGSARWPPPPPGRCLPQGD